MEFADWAWRAILVWFGLLAILDVALKLTVEKREKRVMKGMEENDDADY